jgi:hypothetical protein
MSHSFGPLVLEAVSCCELANIELVSVGDPNARQRAVIRSRESDA